MLSQRADINLANKTVTLDEVKSIDVAKIIKNEARLKEENARLVDYIKTQDSIIQTLADRNIEQLKRINGQNLQLDKIASDINKLSEKQLELEEGKWSSSKLFIKGRLDYYPGIKTAAPGAGFIFMFKNFGLGGNIGTSGKEFYYGAELALSLF